MKSAGGVPGITPGFYDTHVDRFATSFTNLGVISFKGLI